MSPINSGVNGPNFTKFSHNMQASYALLTRAADIAIRFLAIVHPMQVVSVDVDTFLQHYLVAMATSLDK